jgi:hypothetical protein
MKQRHSLRELLRRGAALAAGSVGVGLGIYPLAPQIGLAVARKLAGRPQPPHLVRTIAAEWACSLALQAVRPVALFGMPLGKQAQGPRPVILLHGYLQGRANFLLLARRLAAAGIGPLFGFEYWTLARLGRAAEKLAEFVDEVRAETGAAKVDLIGHSMGGVVARAYASQTPGTVEHLVTIGSPHGGSAMAGFGVGWPAVELALGSEVLASLAAAPAPPGVRVTCIWSRADGLVWSHRAAVIPGADEVVYDDLGHLSLLTSRRVAREIALRLVT